MLQEPPVHTHTFKQKQHTTTKQKTPHAHPARNTTQQSNASKKDTGTNKEKTHRQEPENTSRPSKTKHEQTAGPTEDRTAHLLTLTPEGPRSYSRRKKARNQQDKQKQESATHVSYKYQNKQGRENTKQHTARPRRAKGVRVNRPRARKRIRPPPSCQLAILPIHEGVGRDGLSARRG